MSRTREVTRRSLLLAAPAAGGAALAGQRAEADDLEPADPPDHRQPSLARSGHVETYYKLARD